MSATSARDRDPSERFDPARFSLSRLGRSWPRTVLLTWLVACAWLFMLVSERGVPISGDLEGLVPEEHRARADESLLLLEHGDEQEGSPGALLAAASAVADVLGAQRVPIAAPRGDMEAWLDAHALFLLPAEAHDDLADRLGNEAITASIEGVRARLSSPLHGMMGDDVRRDPLGLAGMMRNKVARSATDRPMGPSHLAEPTAAGDLLAADGDALLMALRTDRPAAVVLAEVRGVIDPDVSAVILGPSQRSDGARQIVEAQRWPVMAALVCGLVIVLGMALRAVRPILAIVACIASGVFALVVLDVPLGVFSLPMLVLLAGFACEGALHLQRISQRGWPAAIVLGTVLLPLQLSPYPEWRSWSVSWLLGVAIIMFVLRLVLPAMLTVMGASTAWTRRGFDLRPMRVTAVVVTVAVLGAGAYAAERLEYRGVDRIELGERTRPAAMARLAEAFFDPSLVAEAHSEGGDAVAALERAAIDTELLSALVPGEAVRIDGPGHVVLLQPELERRRAALAGLDLRNRMQELRSALESRGFRPDAFGEFIRGASDLETMPSAATAVQGPLGPWIDRFVETTPDGVVIGSRVHLVPDPDAAVPNVVDDQGRRVELRGPVVAARRDRDRFRDWLGIYALTAIWLGALAVWLGTRSLPVALSAAFAALVTQTAVLLVMLALGRPLGPHMVPAFLLVGAAATIASGRACRAIDLNRPLHAMGLIVTSACQVVAGLALVTTGVPVWTEIGLVAAAGAAIASGTGLFVAPGMARLLRRVLGSEASP